MLTRTLRLLVGLAAALAVGSPASVPLHAQSAAPANAGPQSKAAQASPATARANTAPSRKTTRRTPWGDPDLEGIWDYKTITPLERPQNVAGREFLTDEEANALETRAGKRLDEPPDPTAPAGGTVHAPYWTDPGRKVLENKRTSLIIDPADGRVPPLTQEAQDRARTGRVGGRNGGDRPGGRADGPEDRSNLERCITQGMPGATLPTLYNNNIRIVQGPGYVAITHEMVHDTRIIPLDGRAPLGSAIRQWFGDSRGHWDGDTLVVDTTNFTDKTNFRGSGRNLHLVERFTRVDRDTLGFQVTMDDPTTWVRPWTVALPMTASSGLYEYACHESNLGLLDILEVARDEDKAAAKK